MSRRISNAAAQPWAQLELFRIYKDIFPGDGPVARVFNNGRQRCQVRIRIAASDVNHNPIDLSAADIATMELIDYVTGEPLPRQDDGKPDVPWEVSSNASDYVWDESVITAVVENTVPNPAETTADAVNEPPYVAGDTSLTLYVSTTATAARQLAARIELPSRTGAPVHFTTNASVSDPDGKGKEGQFNSFVVVEPIAFPSLPISSYGDTDGRGRLNPVCVGNQDHFYWTCEHYLHVNYNGISLPEVGHRGRVDGRQLRHLFQGRRRRHGAMGYQLLRATRKA